jgi:hypothetical protein
VAETPDRLSWRRSSACSYGNCVEVHFSGGSVTIRSTRDPGRQVEFTEDEWTTFLVAARDGEFDGP